MSEPAHPLIDGERVAGEAGVRESINPFTREAFATTTLASPAQVAHAVERSHHRFGDYRRTTTDQRARWLRAIGQGVAARRDDLARTIALEVGKPIQQARGEVDRATFTFRVAAEEAPRLYGETIPMDYAPNGRGYLGMSWRQPRGVVAAITPFNFPLNLLVHKVAPALASGNTVVAKPAGTAALTALKLAEIALEVGLPAGAFSVVPTTHEGADVLVTHPEVRMVSFTGSVPVGAALHQKVGLKPITLELGSNAPNIVTASADLAAAVPALVTGAYVYAGQICISVQRIYAHESLRADFEPLFVEGAETLRVGDPLEDATQVGPMITEDDLVRALQWIDEARAAGARVLCGGLRAGPCILPTVIADPAPDLRCVRNEMFAPVATVEYFQKLSDAVDRANQSRYGLNAAIFTADLREAFYAIEHLEAGTVVVNQSSIFRADHMPYGGVRESGLGREGIRFAMGEMTEIKLAALNLG